jgi:3-phenylpropionate/cinnamic acid dioxygenase small subunit
VKEEDNTVGKRRFHFESFWTRMEGFQDVVLEAWNSVHPARCPFITLDRKLKETAKRSRTWSDKRVGHIVSQLCLAKKLLHKLEIAQDHMTLAPAESWLKNRLKKQSLLLASFKRTMARLRSRITRIKDGDANTKYFHMHARYRKRKNLVTLLKDGDNIVTSQADKANLVDQFYSNLIGQSVFRESTIDLEALVSQLITSLLWTALSLSRRFGKLFRIYLPIRPLGQMGSPGDFIRFVGTSSKWRCSMQFQQYGVGTSLTWTK